jgi:hypothetical protein
MQIEAIVVEILWGLPLLAVSVPVLALISKASHPKHPVISLLVGATLGSAYAVVVSLIVGPMITAVPVPFLPFMGTMGMLVGVLRGAKNWRQSLTYLNISAFLILVGFIWVSYFTARRYLDQAAGSFRIVVMRRNDPSARSIQRNEDNEWVSLSKEERKRVQETVGSKKILRTLTSLDVGEHPKGTAVLVMIRDTTQRIQFPMPDDGVAIFFQNEDGTWRENIEKSHIGMNKLVVSPDGDTNFTRIEVEGPFGSQGTEVGVSH